MHLARVRLLETLADSVGCHLSLATSLPDGCRPDVLRLAIETSTLFVGEAKHSESPGSLATQARFLTYTKWVAAFRRTSGSAIVCLCTGSDYSPLHWARMARDLAIDSEVQLLGPRVDRIGRHQVLSWLVPPRLSPSLRRSQRDTSAVYLLLKRSPARA